MSGTEWARKALHLSTAMVPLSLARGVSQDRVTLIVTVLFAIACVVEVFRRTHAGVDALFQRTVGWMLRRHEVDRRLTGAFWLLAALLFACFWFDTPMAIVVTWAASVGDACAALVGRAWRAAVPGTGKTLAGSLACVVATAVGAVWLAHLAPWVAVLIGVAAALAEWPTMALDDNVRVAGGAALAMTVLNRLLAR